LITGEILSLLAKEVFPVPSAETLFNQYKDTNSEFDKPNAADIRKVNLHKYIESQKWCSTYIIVGEAPGPKGYRFSGVPFTSEIQLISGKLPFNGHQSSNRQEPYSARGAEVFWKVLLPFHQEGKNFFIWDCVPFHPHEKGKFLSPIRTPTTAELKCYSSILFKLIKIINPVGVVAVGRKAERALDMVNIKAKYVRHPSRGGAEDFEKGVKQIFSELTPSQ
jgi:hypothetical protein